MEHTCRLAGNKTRHILLPLHPNASLCQKFRRKFQEIITVDLRSRKCNQFFGGLKSPMRTEMRRHIKSSYFYIIHPFSKMGMVLEVIFFIVWFWRYFTVLIFHSISNDIFNSHIRYLTYVIDILHIFLIVLTFFTGCANCNMKTIIIDQKQIVKKYLSTYFFFDMMALCHSLIINNAYSDLFISWESPYSFLCFIPLSSYLVRLKTFLNVFKGLIMLYSVKKSFCVVAYHTFILVLLIHTFTCSIYAIPLWIHENDIPDGSLLQIVENRASSSSSLYLECCLLVICHFLGVDYSEDITVPVEQLCLFIMIFTGRIYTLFLIADLLGVFGFTGTSESEYERNLAQLNALMRSENLSMDLRKKLVNYYECKYMKNHFNEDEIFSAMDDFMKTELLLFSARKLLLKIEAFQSIPRTQFVDLFMHKKSTIYLPNDVISKRGSTVDKIYFICYGTVAVLNAKDREIIHIKDGDHFGLISYWTSPDLEHIFSHVAVETCEIFMVSTKIMNEFFYRNQEAKKYFENKARETIQLYKLIDKTISRGGTDLLSELRGKLLFEVPKLRPFARD